MAGKSWPKLGFYSPKYSAEMPLHPLRYYKLRSDDFYDFMQREVLQHERVEVVQAKLISASEIVHEVKLHTTAGTFTADWFFDSQHFFNAQQPLPASELLLWQHFAGWLVETEQPVFDPEVATFFDFTVEQHNEVRFMYLLPESATRSLVEYTLFSADLLPPEQYQQELRTYMAERYPEVKYKIVEREAGKIPMSAYNFPRAAGNRHIYIGTSAGMAKASTGFTFQNIQADSHLLATCLAAGKALHKLPTGKANYRLYDRIMLQVMHKHGPTVRNAFADLFKQLGPQHMLRYLSETASFKEQLQVMLAVDKTMFSKAALNSLNIRL